MITNNGAYGTGEHDAFLEALQGPRRHPARRRGRHPRPEGLQRGADAPSARRTRRSLFIGAEEVESGLIAKQARTLGITGHHRRWRPASAPRSTSTRPARPTPRAPSSARRTCPTTSTPRRRRSPRPTRRVRRGRRGARRQGLRRREDLHQGAADAASAPPARSWPTRSAAIKYDGLQGALRLRRARAWASAPDADRHRSRTARSSQPPAEPAVRPAALAVGRTGLASRSKGEPCRSSCRHSSAV